EINRRGGGGWNQAKAGQQQGGDGQAHGARHGLLSWSKADVRASCYYGQPSTRPPSGNCGRWRKKQRASGAQIPSVTFSEPTGSSLPRRSSDLYSTSECTTGMRATTTR